MDRIHKRAQVLLHSCNTTAIEDVESGALAEFLGTSEGRKRGEVNFNAGMGRLASTEGGGKPEIGRAQYGSKENRRGRLT